LTATPPAPSPAGLPDILDVDDDALVLDLLDTLPQRQGFAVGRASGGAAAVEPRRTGQKPKGRSVPLPSTAEKLAEK
jgi:hypothetical protein